MTVRDFTIKRKNKIPIVLSCVDRDNSNNMKEQEKSFVNQGQIFSEDLVFCIFQHTVRYFLLREKGSTRERVGSI